MKYYRATKGNHLVRHSIPKIVTVDLSQRRVFEPRGANMHPCISLFVDSRICGDLVAPIFEILGIQNDPTHIFRPILAAPLGICDCHSFEHFVNILANIITALLCIKILIENPVPSVFIVLPDVEDIAAHCSHVSEAGLDVIEFAAIEETVKLR